MMVESKKDLDGLKRFAEALASELHPGSVVCLSGPLGAGKTTFSQFLCRALGVDDYVTSPTFNLMNVYEAAGGTMVYHFDAYRLSDPDEIGIDDYLYGKGISIVEWAEQIADWIPEDAIWITLEHDDPTHRRVLVSGLRRQYENDGH